MRQAAIFDQNIERGVSAGIIEFNDEERKRITYHTTERKEYRFTDPEEIVRASYFVEVVLEPKQYRLKNRTPKKDLSEVSASPSQPSTAGLTARPNLIKLNGIVSRRF